MKTFDEKDLITWSNREKAVIGNEYYFGNTIDTIQGRIETGEKYRLDSINNHTFNYTFKKDCANYYACILPVEAVKENKTYRACRNVKELYELVFDTKSKAEESFYIEELLGAIIHLRNKETSTEYFTTISTITKDINDYIKVVVSLKGYLSFGYLSFTDLFNNYEIEINGEWRPFGVLEK